MEAKFAVGDKVGQSAGDKFVGTVKAVFTTNEGEIRYAGRYRWSRHSSAL